MRLSRPHQLMIVALCVAMLLLSQAFGLHQHRHVELGKQSERHPTLLHFADAGQHKESGHDHSNASQDEHPHLDIEFESVGDVLLKVFVDILPALFAVGVLLFLLSRAPALRQSVPAEVATSCRSVYALRPPSQAPPLSLVAA